MSLASLRLTLTALVLIVCTEQVTIKSTQAKPMTHAINESPPPPASQEQLSHFIHETQSPLSSLNDPIHRAIHYHFEQKMEPFLRLHKFNSTTTTTSSDTNDDDGNNHKLNGVTCNDGSPTGYYKRLNSHSKSWIIYLQGGGFCASDEACRHRWRRSPHLMSSNYWPKLKSIDGILSSEPKDNPYLWNANHIYVPYCSSDSWTGLQEARTSGGGGGGGESRGDRTESMLSSSYAFMGSRIIEKVLYSLFDELPRESSLHEAKFILLAGDSAGATGVIMNLDKVNRLIQQKFSNNSTRGDSQSNCSPQQDNQQVNCSNGKQVPVLRGLADSGWFLDNEPFEFSSGTGPPPPPPPPAQESNSAAAEQAQLLVDCDRQRCTPLQSIRQAMNYWNGQVPAACASRHPMEPWRCYFAYRAYASLKTPLFVVQWLYDEAQLMVDNILRPETIGQWNYVNKLAGEMRASLENVTALFAPSCLSHSLIVKQSWNQININGFKLPHILNNWEEEILAGQPTLEILNTDYDLQQQQQQHQQQLTLTISDQQAALISRNGDLSIYDRMYQTPASSFELRSAAAPQRSISGGGSSGNSGNTSTRPKSRKKKRNNNNNNNNNQQQQQSSNRIVPLTTSRLSRSTSVVDDATIVFNNNVPDVLILSTSKQQEGPEKYRLIDSCGWPQCNRDCPYLDQDFNLRPIISYRR